VFHFHFNVIATLSSINFRDRDEIYFAAATACGACMITVGVAASVAPFGIGAPTGIACTCVSTGQKQMHGQSKSPMSQEIGPRREEEEEEEEEEIFASNIITGGGGHRGGHANLTLPLLPLRQSANIFLPTFSLLRERPNERNERDKDKQQMIDKDEHSRRLFFLLSLSLSVSLC